MERVASSSLGSDCPGCRERDRRLAELEGRLAQLEQRTRDLEQQLQAALGQAKRQAAPFSKGPPKADPQPPGRKRGPDYGTKARRAVPPQIDEVHEAPLPPNCPACGGSVVQTHVACQYQVEIPRRPIYRQFQVAVGCCLKCQKRLQGRHPLQTSDALGACASQLGAEAQAAIVSLNKELGLSHGKIARFFQSLFGIELSRGGVCQAMQRVARRCAGIDQAIRQQVRQEGWAAVDDTSWKIGGHGGFLHVAVSPSATAYLIDPGRSSGVVERLLGWDYGGVLIHDGAMVYDWFWRAEHQTCLFHLLRRCRELIGRLSAAAGRLPVQVKAVLQEGLALRDARESKRRSVRATRMRAAVLEGKLRSLLRRPWRHPENARLAKHLAKHLRQVFLFLKRRGIDPTSYRAEQALRGAVVNRKVWGGSRTAAGAWAQQVLMSVLRTAKQWKREMIRYLGELLRSPPGGPLPELMMASPGA